MVVYQRILVIFRMCVGSLDISVLCYLCSYSVIIQKRKDYFIQIL